MGQPQQPHQDFGALGMRTVPAGVTNPVRHQSLATTSRKGLATPSGTVPKARLASPSAVQHARNEPRNGHPPTRPAPSSSYRAGNPNRSGRGYKPRPAPTPRQSRGDGCQPEGACNPFRNSTESSITSQAPCSRRASNTEMDTRQPNQPNQGHIALVTQTVPAGVTNPVRHQPLATTSRKGFATPSGTVPKARLLPKRRAADVQRTPKWTPANPTSPTKVMSRW